MEWMAFSVSARSSFVATWDLKRDCSYLDGMSIAEHECKQSDLYILSSTVHMTLKVKPHDIRISILYLKKKNVLVNSSNLSSP